MQKKHAPRNRTIKLTSTESRRLGKRLLKIREHADLQDLLGRTIQQDFLKIAAFLPRQSVDLLVLDPPYNLYKSFKKSSFKKQSIEKYSEYIDQALQLCLPLLKPDATVYICADWHSSTSIHLTAAKYFNVRNRITWQREKGRGAKTNWKNSSEDIWFCTLSENYTFNIDQVKERRRVIAPYRENGAPKDWSESDEGNFRITHPGNIWTDISVPYWSMKENTEHPTQKPEKLIAKLILASSNEGDVVFDPFLGSGTTSATAKKLNRRFFGVEKARDYACLAEKRIELAEDDKIIQGYDEGIFWERNTFRLLHAKRLKNKK